jgi:phage terminase large subunit-like protein
VEGRIPAARWQVAACARQLRDLSRAETPDFPYRYDAARGARVCLMLELLPHVKGRWKSRTIVLEAWQIFLVMTLFSWVFSTEAHADQTIRDKDGTRRFRIGYVEVPRKNAKSTLAAGLGLYMLGPDREPGAECYSAATTRDQARIVFNIARRMALKTPRYCSKFGVEPGVHALASEDSESTFQPLSSDDKNLDGLNPHLALVDELHAHRTRGVWDVLESAMGARDQPLLLAITTAGADRSGVCFEQRGYLLKILAGALAASPEVADARGLTLEGATAEDESFFGIVYTIDDEDDWADPAAWAKANPNLGVSVKLDYIARACRKAQQLPSAQPNFLTKHLDVWVNADSPWMDMRAWDRCADHTLDRAAFRTDPGFVALDLSSKTDIAARVEIFTRLVPTKHPKTGELEDKVHYYAFGKFYVPEDTVEASDNSQYVGWAAAGHLTQTDGNTTDFELIKDDLVTLRADHDLRAIGYDSFQALKLANELTEDGFPMIEVPQQVKHLSEPMKELEALVLSGRFHHDGNPAFTWMISNVVCHTDAKDNIYPRKPTANAKIDGPVAAIMALSRALFEPPPTRSVYEDRGSAWA